MSRLPAAKRREQLLDAALDLFARHGYARATTSELAKAAGVTEPIIYRHFSSKKDLFIALVERTGEQTLEQWAQDLKTAPDPGERLRRIIGDNPMVSARGRIAYRVLLQSITESDDEQIRAAVSNHIRSVHAFLVKEVMRAQEGHRVTGRYSAEILAWLLIHIGMGYGVVTALGVERHGFDESGAHVQEIITRLLVGKGESRPGENKLGENKLGENKPGENRDAPKSDPPKV
ncbi:MAG: TetR/AcrR family transcriptional regulator [Phycisphaeraceae bacterium]|nr:TetR/AcrR family transcriptional regulator [Phycisphaeraceae bacterium]